MGVRADICPALLHTSTSCEGSIYIEAIYILSAYFSSCLSYTVSRSSFWALYRGMRSLAKSISWSNLKTYLLSIRLREGYSNPSNHPSERPSMICPLSYGPYWMQLIYCLYAKARIFSFSISRLTRLRTIIHRLLWPPCSKVPTITSFGASKIPFDLPKERNSLLRLLVHLSKGI